MTSALLTSTLVDPQTVKLERLLPGPVERVWEYLIRPDLQRRWLAGDAAEFRAVTRCLPNRSIEFALPDSSIVSMELEPRGKEVKLVLTHRRRAPAWLAGAGTALVVALAVFAWGGSSDGPGRTHPDLGIQAARSHPSLNAEPAELKFRSSSAEPLYGMLGGRC